MMLVKYSGNGRVQGVSGDGQDRVLDWMDQHGGSGEDVLDGGDSPKRVLGDLELPFGCSQGVVRGWTMWARRGRNPW